MFRSFLTITVRVLWRNKVTSFVNIFSLTIGITSFILIMLYVNHELSYDKFHENYDHIYRLEGDDNGKLPPAIAEYLEGKIPEIKNIASLSGEHKSFIGYIPEDRAENLKEVEASFFFADSAAFDVFTLPFIQGDPNAALNDAFTVVLTESTATKLFSGVNPIGKRIAAQGFQFSVTGIIRDIKNSHIEIDALFSQETLPKVFPNRDLNERGSFSWLWSATYLLIDEKADKGLIESKINEVLAEINQGGLSDLQFQRFHIRTLKDIYFARGVQHLQYGLHGNLTLIQVFLAIGIFMLVLAVVNYINLTTARSSIRAKEMALKKLAGSSSLLLGYQLILESIIVAFVSFVLSITLLQLFLSTFNLMAMVDLHFAELNRPIVWAGAVSSVVLIGIVAGLYPAVYVTAIKTIGLMKGQGVKGSGGFLFRKALMTFQFAISILLITILIANLRQIEYIKTADLGYIKEEIIMVNSPSFYPEQHSQRETFKKRILQYPDITQVTFSAGSPGGNVPTILLEVEGIERTMGFFCIDQNYLEVMNIKVAEGRNFSSDRPAEMLSFEHLSSNGKKGFASSGKTGLLLNQTAVREFGLDSPVGKILRYQDQEGAEHQYEIVGIVRDFHFRSLHHKVEPLALLWTSPMHYASIKISSSNVPATLKQIEKEFKNVYGPKPFPYQFLDDVYSKQYTADENLATLIGYFTGLAIMIACLGLFALSSFTVSRRTKEIGVRKCLGASVKTIYVMLSWDFLRWILLAVLFACPVALFLINLWLRSFAYRIKVGPDIFILATLMTLGIALLTVTWQSLRAAYANPVNALRHE